MKDRVYIFRVYTLAGELIVQGNAAECAEALGLKKDGVKGLVERSRNGAKLKRYRIEEVRFEDNYNTGMVQAAKNWDAFVKPLREKYGIPVYRGEKNDG